MPRPPRSPLPTAKASSPPSEPGGIYFVVPFPDGWEICAFPFKSYPDIGHAFIWEQAVAPQLALRWARRLHSAAELDHQPHLITNLAARLANLYDAVPRGRAQASADTPRHCVVYHGDDLTPAMTVTRRPIEKHLRLPAGTRWVIDHHETRNPDSTQQLLLLLNLPLEP